MTVLAAVAPAWTTARASGTAALLCSSLALAAGLLMALRPVSLRGQKLELRAAHEALALATFALIAVHGLSLFLDPVLRPGVAGVLVPFGSGFQRLGVAFGQIAAYGMVALGATFYIRRRLGSQRWRNAHRFIPIFWALAVGHAALTGTDVSSWWFLLAVAPPVLAGLALLASRHLEDGAGPAMPRDPARPHPAPLADHASALVQEHHVEVEPHAERVHRRAPWDEQGGPGWDLTQPREPEQPSPRTAGHVHRRAAALAEPR
jgi:sulfoxide reductase heme-binding subunit YedZ